MPLDIPDTSVPTEGLPTHDELCTTFGYATLAEYRDWCDDTSRGRRGESTPRWPDSVRADSAAEAWSFVLAARSRGWIVSDPEHNGMPGDTHHVTIWQKGTLDREAEGRYRRSP